MAIEFYKVSDQYGCFSNFSKHSFTIDNIFYQTVEHYFQSQKFINPKDIEDILKCKSAIEAASKGRDRDRKLRSDWEEIKDDVMRTAVYEKFKQNDDIRVVLIDTGSETIIEKTTNDYYWGCGLDGTGKNMLGIILMETREKLKNEK